MFFLLKDRVSCQLSCKWYQFEKKNVIIWKMDSTIFT